MVILKVYIQRSVCFKLAREKVEKKKADIPGPLCRREGGIIRKVLEVDYYIRWW
jgi:hypothetical protein